MPKDAPKDKKCTGADAEQVAAYLYETFYSKAARDRAKPPRIELSRLTVQQYRNAVADLIATFRPPGRWDEQRGLKGEYFAVRRFQRDKRVIERVDPNVDFGFGAGSPDAKLIPGDEYAIRWTGSLLADETGEYEFVVRSENGVRLWVNAANDGGNRDRGDMGGGTRGGDDPLIDEWVSSGAEPREHRKRLFLLGGRAYPLDCHRPTG